MEHNRPEPDNIYTICFTSGTTGMPKGALVTHKSLVSMVASIKYTGIELLPSDSALSYLPLSHMMERVVVMGLSYFGGRIGFFSGDITQIRSDLTAL